MAQHQMQHIIDNAWDNRANITGANATHEVRDAVDHVIAELNAGRLREFGFGKDADADDHNSQTPTHAPLEAIYCTAKKLPNMSRRQPRVKIAPGYSIELLLRVQYSILHSTVKVGLSQSILCHI